MRLHAWRAAIALCDGEHLVRVAQLSLGRSFPATAIANAPRLIRTKALPLLGVEADRHPAGAPARHLTLHTLDTLDTLDLHSAALGVRVNPHRACRTALPPTSQQLPALAGTRIAGC